jgi:hypothetical protein
VIYSTRNCSVPPRWIVEPKDKAFALGSDAQLECKADGFPKPTISWKKAAGELKYSFLHLLSVAFLLRDFVGR